MRIDHYENRPYNHVRVNAPEFSMATLALAIMGTIAGVFLIRKV